VRFELSCAAPDDTEAALSSTPTYAISIHSLDASRNPVDEPLLWYAEVDSETANDGKSKGPHAIFDLSAADIANITAAGEYWIAFHASSGGERIPRAAGYITFADDGFPTDPPTPTPPGTVYLTQAVGDSRYVRDPGTVVDNTLVRWNGTSGNQVQGSGVTVSDTGDMGIPGALSLGSGSELLSIRTDNLTADRTHQAADEDGVFALTGETDGKVRLIDLKDVTITTPSTGQVLTWNGTAWVNSAPSGGGGGGGSVTITGNDGIGVAGSPGSSITLSLGNITPDALDVTGTTVLRGAFTMIHDGDLDVAISAANLAEGGATVYWPSGGGNLATVAGTNGDILSSDVTDGTTVGRNLFKLANPGAIAFLRMNADNTVSALSDSSMRTALGLGNVATRNVGTTTGTAAAGDDARFHSAVTLGISLESVLDISGQNLVAVTAPAADRIVFFDQSEGTWEYLTVGSGLSISGQTITASGTGDVTGPASSTDNAITRFDGTTGKVIQNSTATLSDTGGIAADTLAISTTPTGAGGTGIFRYDAGEKVPEVGIDGITLKIGVQEYVRVYNSTASTLTKGQVVYINGAQGNRVSVALSDASSQSTSAGTIGFVAQSITAGSEGFVQTSGPMYSLNTIGLTAGALLFLSETAGEWTVTEPTAPAHGVRLGYVERVHATVGSVFIKIDDGYELGELHNVSDGVTGAIAFLVKNASTNLWESKNAADSRTALGLGSLATQSGTFSGTSSGTNTGNVTLAAELSSIITLTGQQLGAVTDPGADRIVFFDQSANAVAGAWGYLTAGTGLNITGTTLTATIAGTGSELQVRDSATGALAAVAGTSVSGTTVIMGAGDNLGTGTAERLRLRNTTPSVSGTNQNSPAVAFEGSAWQTSASASQACEMRAYVIPQTGASIAAGRLTFEARLNGGAWSEIAAFRAGFGTSGLFLGSGSFANIITSNNSVGVYASSNQLVLSVSTTGGHFVGPFSVRSGANDATLNADAAHQLAQRSGTNAQVFRVYDTFASATDYQRVSIATARAVLSGLSGASVTATSLIPAGAVVVGVTAKVLTAVTGATSWQLGTAADPDRFAAAGGIALGSTTQNADWTAGGIECFPAATNLILTANGSNFTAGSIQISVQYLRGEAD
jgi:hypothetical protein